MTNGREREGKLEGVRADLVRRLAEDMAADPVNWIKSWSADMPRNALSGKRYRGRNALLLTYCMRARGLTDPRFITFNQARQAGFSEGQVVRKGARSFPIERWKVFWDRVVDGKRKRLPAPDTPEALLAYEADPLVHRSLKPVGYFNVFNAEDVIGIPAYEPVPAPPETGLVDFLEGASPCPVREVASQGEAYYDPSADAITLPARREFSSEGAMARVLLHEQGHATGAPSRLDRLKGASFGDDAYAAEELVAELSSLFCANELGVRVPAVGESDAASPYWRNHVAYLQSWSSRLEDPEAALFSAAARAGEAADYLMGECFGPALEAIDPVPAPEAVAVAAEALAMPARWAEGRGGDAR